MYFHESGLTQFDPNKESEVTITMWVMYFEPAEHFSNCSPKITLIKMIDKSDFRTLTEYMTPHCYGNLELLFRICQ